MTLASVAGLLRHLRLVDRHPALAAEAPPPGRPRIAEVTQVVTAATASFAFVQPFRGGDMIRTGGTLIATDGDNEIRTPHRRLPAGDAEPAPQPRPHGGAAGAHPRRLTPSPAGA